MGAWGDPYYIPILLAKNNFLVAIFVVAGTPPTPPNSEFVIHKPFPSCWQKIIFWPPFLL